MKDQSCFADNSQESYRHQTNWIWQIESRLMKHKRPQVYLEVGEPEIIKANGCNKSVPCCSATKELAEYTTGQINELPAWYKLKQPDIHKKLLRNGGLMTLVKSSQYKRQSALVQKH